MVAAERESGEKGGEEFPDIFILFTSEPRGQNETRFLLSIRIISLCLSLQF